jgi:hypothetical protein
MQTPPERCASTATATAPQKICALALRGPSRLHPYPTTPTHLQVPGAAEPRRAFSTQGWACLDFCTSSRPRQPGGFAHQPAPPTSTSPQDSAHRLNVRIYQYLAVQAVLLLFRAERFLAVGFYSRREKGEVFHGSPSPGLSTFRVALAVFFLTTFFSPTVLSVFLLRPKYGPVPFNRP